MIAFGSIIYRYYYTNRKEQTMPEDKLLPCPFCGGRPKIILHAACYIISCQDCPGSIIMGPYQTKEEAIKAWNRRVQPVAPDWIPENRKDHENA